MSTVEYRRVPQVLRALRTFGEQSQRRELAEIAQRTVCEALAIVNAMCQIAHQVPV